MLGRLLRRLDEKRASGHRADYEGKTDRNKEGMALGGAVHGIVHLAEYVRASTPRLPDHRLP